MVKVAYQTESWFGFDTFLGKRDEKKIANNTWVIREYLGDGSPAYRHPIHIKLHNTNIMTFYREGNIKLNSGGWRTVTTSQRINQFLPGHIRVSSDKGVWWVYMYGERTLFVDNMEINPDGTLPPIDDEHMRQIEADKKDKKRIKKYVDGLTEEVYDKVLATDGKSDCLYCQIEFGNPSFREVTDHLDMHMQESYYMITLLASAVRAAGYKYEFYLSRGMGHTLPTVKRCLRKYMTKRIMGERVQV